jgi:MSHA pilin protein MshC
MEKEPAGSFFYCRGFTIVELVVIIVIVGVISIFVSARLSGSVEQTRAFYDELLTQVQFARKVAVAQRRAVFVRIAGAQSRLCYSKDGACTGTDAVASPRGAAPFAVAVPSGVTLTPAAVTFQFDALGRYRDLDGVAATAQLALSVAGDGNYQFLVEHETGYVR